MSKLSGNWGKIFFVKLQIRKQSPADAGRSTSELVSWTIPRSGGYNTAAACFGGL